jgi:hypothetical protein
MITLEENRTLGRHVATQAGRPSLQKEPPAPVFCRQASLSFLSLRAQVLVLGTTIDVDNLPKLDSSSNTHP